MARTIVARPGVGVSAHIVQNQELNFVRLVLEQPTFIWVRRGVKTLTTQQGVYTIHAGQAVAIAGGQTCDISNQPAATGGYEASWITWEPSLLQGYHPGKHSTPICSALVLVQPALAVEQAYERAAEAIRDQATLPLEIARHCLEEMLLWLEHSGGHFLVQSPVSVTAQIRQLLSSAPAQHWTAPFLARRMAMSEATLRRRLAAESTHLSALLVDVRMTFALTLLQSTDRPVTEIALQAGYESASRFAIRFRQRFGFSPSAIRAHQRPVA